MDTLWEAFVVVVWSTAVFIGKLVELALAWVNQQQHTALAREPLPQHAKSHAERPQEASVLDWPVYYLDLESQFSSPPSVCISLAIAATHSDLDWHVHNVCRLDSPGYRAAVRRHRWRFISFKQRLEAERHHFNFLLAEDLRFFELQQHTRSWRVPSYVSLEKCPPDYTTYPAFYEI
ncbi:hypothetical protein M758_UG114300 [Ceratodon purpureus]|nr:hypothetical protein M758_UG114300 [Ceratodon purpureus]